MTEMATAVDLRREAADACEAKQWAVCLADLDEARAHDPGGDEGPAVKTLRAAAIVGIRKKP
jgi:hypothetical protein